MRIKDSTIIVNNLLSKMWLVLYDRFDDYGFDIMVGDNEDQVIARVYKKWFIDSNETVIPKHEIYFIGANVNDKKRSVLAKVLRNELRILEESK